MIYQRRKKIPRPVFDGSCAASTIFTILNTMVESGFEFTLFQVRKRQADYANQFLRQPLSTDKTDYSQKSHICDHGPPHRISFL